MMMKPLSTYTQPTRTYELIDYQRAPLPSPPFKPKLVQLTEYEAHEKNRALAMNGTTLRYIKNDN